MSVDGRMHDDQIDLPLQTVRSLVDDQFPQWRPERLRMVDNAGTTNVVVRIGEHLAARFPIRAQDPAAAQARLRAEAAALQELAACSSFPSPLPVALGRPGHRYPLPWAVQTWLPGRVASVEDPQHDPAQSVDFALDLASLISRLRAADTLGRRFAGDGRGGELPDHDEWMQECFTRSRDLVDVDRLSLLWDELRRLPRPDADVMSHGDLVPGNVLVARGRLVGILDGGGFGPADPALDLVSAWHLLDREPRELMRETLRCDDDEWDRGMAWALQQAMGLVWYYMKSNPTMSRIGARTLSRILAAPLGGGR